MRILSFIFTIIFITVQFVIFFKYFSLKRDIRIQVGRNAKITLEIGKRFWGHIAKETPTEDSM